MISFLKALNCCFQQDPEPGHKMKWAQTHLTEHIPDFSALSEWPAASPDLNLLNCQLW